MHCNSKPKKMEKGGEAKQNLPEPKRINLPTVPKTKAQKEMLKNFPKPKGMPRPSSKLPKDYELPESMIQKFKGGGSAFPDLTGDGKVTRADILKGRGVKGFKGGGCVMKGRGGSFKGIS